MKLKLFIKNGIILWFYTNDVDSMPKELNFFLNSKNIVYAPKPKPAIGTCNEGLVDG